MNPFPHQAHPNHNYSPRSSSSYGELNMTMEAGFTQQSSPPHHSFHMGSPSNFPLQSIPGPQLTVLTGGPCPNHSMHQMGYNNQLQASPRQALPGIEELMLNGSQRLDSAPFVMDEGFYDPPNRHDPSTTRRYSPISSDSQYGSFDTPLGSPAHSTTSSDLSPHNMNTHPSNLHEFRPRNTSMNSTASLISITRRGPGYRRNSITSTTSISLPGGKKKSRGRPRKEEVDPNQDKQRKKIYAREYKHKNDQMNTIAREVFDYVRNHPDGKELLARAPNQIQEKIMRYAELENQKGKYGSTSR